MTAPLLYRIVARHSYLDREEEYARLSLEEAAARMDDLTGVGADVILADFDEDCGRCDGIGEDSRILNPDWPSGAEPYSEKTGDPCPACHGTGKRGDPWEFVDPETGREVVMRREVE